MHRVIAFAAPVSEHGREALRGMAWPGLQSLLRRLPPLGRDDGDEFSLSPPHERVLARALRWHGDDGAWPFAAAQLATLGQDPGAAAWGLLTPAHWHLGTEQLRMTDPADLMLDEATSRLLLDAVEPLFTTEGFAVRWGAPTAWYIAHPSLSHLPCASLDRVIGRNVDRWLPAGAAVRLLRRLQNEVQMLLYTHPLNDQREARGQLPVNSFWLSGCGVHQPAQGVSPTLDDRLRTAALGEDWAAWAKAWQAIDAELPDAGLQRLTLCGERSSITLEVQPRNAWQRLVAHWQRPDVAALLEAL